MTEVERIKQQVKEQKDELYVFLESYPYEFNEKHIELLNELYWYSGNLSEDANFHQKSERSYYEAAYMYYILFKAVKGKTGVIFKSKTTNDKIDIIYMDSLINLLEFFSNSLIYSRHEDYMKQFGWDYREEIPPLSITLNLGIADIEDCMKLEKVSDLTTNISKPYNEEEIKQILKYEKKQMQIVNTVKRERLSYYLNKIVNCFIKDGIFKAGKKPICVDDACFLFNTLCYYEIWEENELLSNKDKYDRVRFELKKLKHANLQDEITLLIP